MSWAAIVPHRPYTPGVQALTWALFVLVLAAFLWRGQRMAWLKVQPYVEYKLREAADNKEAGQISARMVWIYMIYAYAYAYARVIFTFLWVALALIFLRMALCTIPQFTPALERGIRALAGVLDAGNVLEFMHYRHWRHHVYALAAYLLTAFALAFALLGGQRARSQSEATRAYRRAVLLASGVLLAYYAIYAGRSVVMAAHECGPV